MIYSSFDNAWHPPSWFAPTKKAAAPPAKKVATTPVKAVAKKVATTPVKAVAKKVAATPVKAAAPAKKAAAPPAPVKKAVAPVAPVRAPVTNARPATNPLAPAVARSLTAQTSPGTPAGTKALNGPQGVTLSSGRPLSSKGAFETAVSTTRSPAGTAMDLANTARQALAGQKVMNGPGLVTPSNPVNKAGNALGAVQRAIQLANTAKNLTNTGGGTYTPGGTNTGTGGGGRIPTAPIPTAPRTPTALIPPGGTTTAPPAPPITTPTIPTAPTGSFTTVGGGTAGRFARQRQNRGPRSGMSMTPELLRRLARERYVRTR